MESEQDFHVMRSSFQQELLFYKPKAGYAKLYNTLVAVKRTGITVTATDEVLAQKKPLEERSKICTPLGFSSPALLQ